MGTSNQGPRVFSILLRVALVAIAFLVLRRELDGVALKDRSTSELDRA